MGGQRRDACVASYSQTGCAAPSASARIADISRKEAARALKAELKAVVQQNPSDSAHIQNWLDQNMKTNASGVSQLMREFCRNCLLAGRGMQNHGFKRCKEMGNECVLPCTLCAQAGRGIQKHWQVDCPR